MKVTYDMFEGCGVVCDFVQSVYWFFRNFSRLSDGCGPLTFRIHLELIFLLHVWLFRPLETFASFKEAPVFLYYLLSAAISILSALVNHSLHLPALSLGQYTG